MKEVIKGHVYVNCSVPLISQENDSEAVRLQDVILAVVLLNVNLVVFHFSKVYSEARALDAEDSEESESDDQGDETVSSEPLPSNLYATISKDRKVKPTDSTYSANSAGLSNGDDHECFERDEIRIPEDYSTPLSLSDPGDSSSGVYSLPLNAPGPNTRIKVVPKPPPKPSHLKLPSSPVSDDDYSYVADVKPEPNLLQFSNNQTSADGYSYAYADPLAEAGQPSDYGKKDNVYEDVGKASASQRSRSPGRVGHFLSKGFRTKYSNIIHHFHV